MARQIIKLPNGKYAEWSTVVDNFVFMGTRKEIIRDRLKERVKDFLRMRPRLLLLQFDLARLKEEIAMNAETVIKIYEIVGSEFCVASDDGHRVYNEIKFALGKGRNTVLTFKNITHLTSSFLDAAVGQLYGIYSQDELRKRMRWVDIEPDDESLLERVIDTAIRYFKDPDRFKAASFGIAGTAKTRKVSRRVCRVWWKPWTWFKKQPAPISIIPTIYACGAELSAIAPFSSVSLFHVDDARTIPQESFFEKAFKIEQAGQLDSAIDLIYDSVDKLLRDSNINYIDESLKSANVKRYSVDIMLAVLISTYPAKSKLKARNAFFLRVKNHLDISRDDTDQILAGLDG